VPADAPPAAAGLTVAEVARRYRVGKAKVRSWVNASLLAAVNTGTPARPRLVFTPEHLRDFERRLTASPPRPAERRPYPAGIVDFFPDD
jgi:hypothetical protein